MSRSRQALPLLVILLLGFASSSSGRLLQQETTTTAPDESQDDGATVPLMPGSDRDEHGCITSAGFQWCESTQECYRSWENDCPSMVFSTPGLPYMGPGPVIFPEDDKPSAVHDHDDDLPAGQCPGKPGLMGGWTLQANPANDATVQAAAQTVVDALGLSNQVFEVTTACTQVVAGVNYYIQVDLLDKGNATARVYQPLDEDAPMEITSLHYDYGDK